MPVLTPSQVHVNQALTNIAVSSFENQTGFVADKVFPVVPVEKQSDFFWQWARGDINRDEMEKAGPGSEAPLITMRQSTSAYHCDVYKLGAALDDQTRANADSQLRLEAGIVNTLAQKALLKRDVVWINRFMRTGLWNGAADQAGVASSPSTNQFVQFSNYAASDPVAVLEPLLLGLTRQLGVPMSSLTMVMGPEVWSSFKNHPKFLERYEFTQAAILTESLVAGVLGLKQIVVPNAVINTAREGADPVMQFVTPKSILVTYAPDAPSLTEPSAGYMFAWRGLTGTTNGIKTKRYREERRESDLFEIHTAFSPEIIAPYAGFYMSNVVA